jgi:regulatory protein
VTVADAPDGTGRRHEPRTLKSRAIAMLARREYSRTELFERLLATGAGRDECEALVGELVALGFLSDARYAQALVRQRQGGHAQRAIAQALRQKGVDDDTVRSALADHPIDDTVALAALWRRRFGRAPVDEREKARQVRFLQARGFALSAILRLLRDPPADDSGPAGAEGVGK